MAMRRWPARTQRLGGAVAAGDLAGADAREVPVVGVAVEEHDRHARRIELRRHLDLPGHDGGVEQRVDAVAEQRLDRHRLHLGIVEGLGDGDDMAGRPGHFAGAVDRDDRLRAGGDAVEDDGDLARPVGERGVAGDDLVAELLGDLDDALAGVFRDADARRVVEHHRDGRLRAGGEPGDVGHGDPLAGAAAGAPAGGRRALAIASLASGPVHCLLPRARNRPRD